MTLDQIGVKYRTDKSSLSNGYLSQYEPLLPPRESVTKVLEIGVRRCGRWRNNHQTPSLKMWSDWFYNAAVYGFDLKLLKNSEPNITLIVGDQSSETQLKSLSATVGECDLIIDDGSHRPEHQWLSFRLLKDNVRVGGLYVIEDCMASVQNEYEMSKRIHAIVEQNAAAMSEEFDATWCSSAVSGPMSSLVLRRRCVAGWEPAH